MVIPPPWTTTRVACEYHTHVDHRTQPTSNAGVQLRVLFMADPRIRESKAAVAACGAPAAGTFLSTLPRNHELRLGDISFKDAVCHRFRLPNTHRILGDVLRCPCGARPLQDPSAPSFAEHILGCVQCSKGLGVGNPRPTRHNLLLPVSQRPLRADGVRV